MTPTRKRTCDVAEKRHFITEVSYKNFRDGLIEIKYDYADFKQHFLSTVTCCSNRRENTLQKANDTSSSGVRRVPRTWGLTQFRPSHPARSWQHKTEETLQSNALLAII